ncbi:MAG: undecaprenyl-diphosphatase [Thermoleophilaceae bacterium]|nr:undecaprenyl-diphosphatase [Thermoleophilaceae bacterium]
MLLGALQGPTEMLPVSSSGHVALLPQLLGWPYAELDDELRKSFEVALHAGTALALVIALRHEVAEVLRGLSPRRVLFHTLEFLPPAAAAALWERPIEERCGGRRGVAVAQLVGGSALALADRRPAVRVHEDAGQLDALAIGIGQATALAPGISRNGATLTAARLRRFERRSANRLSRHAALPIIVAAAGLKGTRLARRGLPKHLRAPFAAGAAASFASTLAASRLVPYVDNARTYLPFAAYRVALGLAALSSALRPPPSALPSVPQQWRPR